MSEWEHQRKRKIRSAVEIGDIGCGKPNSLKEMTISVRGQGIKTGDFTHEQTKRTKAVDEPCDTGKQKRLSPFKAHLNHGKISILFRSLENNEDNERSDQSSLEIFESDISAESESGWSEWEEMTASESSEEDLDVLIMNNSQHKELNHRQDQDGCIPMVVRAESIPQNDDKDLISSDNYQSQLWAEMAISRIDEAAIERCHSRAEEEPKEVSPSETTLNEISNLTSITVKRVTDYYDEGVDPTDSTVSSIEKGKSRTRSPLLQMNKTLKGSMKLQRSRITCRRWKDDPIESLSDWKIEIYRGEGGEDVYNVHRCIVGVGRRRSRWFAREFRRKNSRHYCASEDPCETNIKISRLSLSMEQAKVFPAILDFMYFGAEANHAFTAKQACVVFQVAEMFEVLAMKKAIIKFYGKNLSSKNMVKFLKLATHYSAEDLIHVTKVGISQIVCSQPNEAKFLQPKLLGEIIRMTTCQHGTHQRTKEMDNNDGPLMDDEAMAIVRKKSQKFSIAAYKCMFHHEAKDQTNSICEGFDYLFCKETLPFIDASVALDVIAMEERRFNGQPTSTLTDLQSRCIDGIVHVWESFEEGYASPRAASEALQGLPSAVLAEILIHNMKRKF